MLSPAEKCIDSDLGAVRVCVKAFSINWVTSMGEDRVNAEMSTSICRYDPVARPGMSRKSFVRSEASSVPNSEGHLPLNVNIGCLTLQMLTVQYFLVREPSNGFHLFLGCFELGRNGMQFDQSVPLARTMNCTFCETSRRQSSMLVLMWRNSLSCFV